MPSSRNILIDLDKHGLAYNKPHSIIGADGRIKPPSAVGAAVSEEVSVEGSDVLESDKKQKHKKPLKSGLVELTDKQVDEIKATTDDDSARVKQKPAVVTVTKKLDVKSE